MTFGAWLSFAAIAAADVVCLIRRAGHLDP
jgi:hypothetical protein